MVSALTDSSKRIVALKRSISITPLILRRRRPVLLGMGKSSPRLIQPLLTTGLWRGWVASLKRIISSWPWFYLSFSYSSTQASWRARVGTDGIRIKEQRLTHLRRRPTLGQQDDSMEAIGFADIQGRPMRSTPFGELAGAEAVVEHGG